MKFVQITKAEMEAVLDPMGFRLMTLPKTKELVWGKREDRNGIQLSVRVFSSINPDGLGRDVGRDAIRVEIATRLPDGTIKRVGGSKRVNRVKGWQQRVRDRVKSWEGLLGPGCPRCGCPTVKRKPKTFRPPFWGCVNFPQCKGVVDC